MSNDESRSPSPELVAAYAQDRAARKAKRTETERKFIELGKLLAHEEMYGSVRPVLLYAVSDHPNIDASVYASFTQEDQNIAHVDHLTRLFDFLVQHCHAIAAAAEDEGLDMDKIDWISHFIDAGRIERRNTDTANVKAAVKNSFNVGDQPYGCLPFTHNIHDRRNRGYNSDETGRLLTPVTMDWDITLHRAQLRMAGCAVPTTSFFHFMYPNALVDLDDIEKGFGEGELVVETLKVILIPKRSGPRKAQILAERSITISQFAYGCTLLHNGLSDATQINKEWSHEGFYRELVTFLSDPEQQELWECRLRPFLVKAVFGGIAPSKTGVDRDIDHAGHLMIQQRARKRTLAESQQQDNQIEAHDIDRHSSLPPPNPTISATPQPSNVTSPTASSTPAELEGTPQVLPTSPLAPAVLPGAQQIDAAPKRARTNATKPATSQRGSTGAKKTALAPVTNTHSSKPRTRGSK